MSPDQLLSVSLPLCSMFSVSVCWSSVFVLVSGAALLSNIWHKSVNEEVARMKSQLGGEERFFRFDCHKACSTHCGETAVCYPLHKGSPNFAVLFSFWETKGIISSREVKCVRLQDSNETFVEWHHITCVNLCSFLSLFVIGVMWRIPSQMCSWQPVVSVHFCKC